MLLLPGELRNRIFYFALQGIHIRVVEKFAKSEEHRVLANQDSSSSSLEAAARVLGLSQTCRQIHSEVGLLPFEHFIMHFQDMRARMAFLRRLTDAQCSAISTVSVTKDFAIFRGKHHVHMIKLLEGRDLGTTAEIWLEKSWRFGKKLLPGLKRVAVEDWTEKDDGTGFLKFLYHCEHNRDVEVVFGRQTRKWDGGTA